jgi:hypothetical protein
MKQMGHSIAFSYKTASMGRPSTNRERLLVSAALVDVGSVGSLGDDIDRVLERDRPKPRDRDDLVDRAEPSDVYDCERDRGAIGTVRLSDELMDLGVGFGSGCGSLGASTPGPGIGRS